MVDDLAATIRQACFKTFGDVVAAGVIALVCMHVEKAALRMIATLVEFITGEFRVAGLALELDNTGEELPEEVTPRDLLRSEAQHKFVEFEGLVCHVGCKQLAVSIDQDLATLALLPASLARCE